MKTRSRLIKPLIVIIAIVVILVCGWWLWNSYADDDNSHGHPLAEPVYVSDEMAFAVGFMEPLEEGRWGGSCPYSTGR